MIERMNSFSRRALAFIAVTALSPLLLGCGEDDSGNESTTSPSSAPAPEALLAINDALAVSGFEVSSTTVGDEEISALVVEGDESVLVFEKSSVEDLDADALSGLVSDEVGEEEPTAETCVDYTIVGPGGDFQDSVSDLVCG